MTEVLVRTPPKSSIEDGFLLLEFESGGESVVLALTRHAAVGLGQELNRQVAKLAKAAPVIPFDRGGKDSCVAGEHGPTDEL